MKILDLMIPGGEEVWYTKAYMDMMEAHLGYFRSSRRSSVSQVDYHKAVVYTGDFFGYLNEVGIEQQYHWLIMRINDMYSNSDFSPLKLHLIIPDKIEIEQIRSAHISTGVIKN